MLGGERKGAFKVNESDRLNYRGFKDLSRVFIRRTDLRGADLSHANLSHADARYADFRGANLKATLLDKTDLSGADLRGVQNLTASQIAAAIISDETRLPDYLATLRAGAENQEVSA